MKRRSVDALSPALLVGIVSTSWVSSDLELLGVVALAWITIAGACVIAVLLYRPRQRSVDDITVGVALKHEVGGYTANWAEVPLAIATEQQSVKKPHDQ